MHEFQQALLQWLQERADAGKIAEFGLVDAPGMTDWTVGVMLDEGEDVFVIVQPA